MDNDVNLISFVSFQKHAKIPFEGRKEYICGGLKTLRVNPPLT